MILKKINNRTRLLFESIAVICVCTILITTAISKKDTDDVLKIIKYTALGDSIPNGYTVSEDDNLKSYPWLLAEGMESKEEMSVSLLKYTKNGLTVNGLNERYLSDVNVQEDLKESDLITVTIGANDLLKMFRELYQKIFARDTEVNDIEMILKVIQEETADKPELLAEAAEIIYGWDCGAFEKDWETAMESIRRSKNEDAQVIVTTIYNPVEEIEALGKLNHVIDGIIDRMNQIIIDNSEAYGYQVADLSKSGIERHLQPDGLHPDQEGQQLIMEKIMKLFDALYDTCVKSNYLC